MMLHRICHSVLALAFAGALPAAATDLVVWHAYRGGEKDAFEKVVATYNAAKAAQGVKVSSLAVPYDAFADKITAAVPRGKGPDIFIYARTGSVAGSRPATRSSRSTSSSTRRPPTGTSSRRCRR